jgi:dihydroorotase
VLFDPEERWTVEPPFVSRSRNSAFIGRELRGRVRCTMLHGELTVAEGKATR